MCVPEDRGEIHLMEQFRSSVCQRRQAIPVTVAGSTNPVLEMNDMTTTKANQSLKQRSSLSKRMKRGELYVVYSGFDGRYMRLLSYGDSKRTPRIYRKDAVDDRLSDSLPICRNMATAEKVLKGTAYAVLLPLSVMVFVWGEREVRSWAKEQRHVSPSEVRDYVAHYLTERSAA